MRSKAIPVLFVLLLCANAVIFFNRDHFIYTKQVSYDALYPQLSALPVKKIVQVSDSGITFKLRDTSRGKCKWIEYCNDRVDSFFSVNPVLHAQKGLNTYRLSTPSCTDTIYARAEYIPAKDNGGAAFLGLYRSNVTKFSVDDIFRRHEPEEAASKDEEQEIKSILADAIAIGPGMTGDEKVKLIGIFLHKKIFASRGQPDDSTIGLDAYRAYLAAAKGTRIWCGIYTRIFNLFARIAGVKSRTVEMFRDLKSLNGSVHEFNEYFSPEKKQWIAVDIMFNNIGYVDGGGNYLTGAQVKNTAHNDTAVKMLRASGDSIAVVPFANAEPLFFDLYDRDKELRLYRYTKEEYCGSLSDRLRNYVWPRYWYEFYSDSRIVSNRNFYLKQLLLVLLLLSGIFTITAEVLKRKKNDRV